MKRYLKSVHLKNFQSYKNETVSFTPGLNILVGSSDSGKTAILRAISFVLHNNPKKDTMIHWGENEMEVTLEFSDGVKVTRTKGLNVNKITAVDSSGKKISKHKIDRQIPDDIKELLGNPPVDDFNGTISYADLYSSLFLVDLSPTELPRALSHLTGVELLEDAAKQLMQNCSSLEKSNKNMLINWNEQKTELESFKPIEEIDERISTIEEKIVKISNIEKTIEELNKYAIYLFNGNTQKIIKKLENMIEEIDKLTQDVKKEQNLFEEIKNIESIMSQIAKFSICDHELKIQSIDSKIKEKEQAIHQAKKCLDTFDAASKFTVSIDSLNTNGKKTADEYRSAKSEYENLEKENNEYRAWLRENNIQCEVCGGTLK